MTRAFIGLVLVALAVADPAAQRFKATAEAVRVDVLVTDGNRPLAGLTTADFELKDRGVIQRIDSIAFEDVPLSVMIALDTSDSLTEAALADLRDAASAATRLLRPTDRSALLTFTHRFSLQADWTNDHRQLAAALQQVTPAGATSLHDAAFAAVTLNDDEPGRRLVLLFSDGQDMSSWLPGQFALDAARRGDAVVYAVGLFSSSDRTLGYRLDFRSGVQPPVPAVQPAVLPETFLTALAADTGGAFLTTDRSDKLRETFVRVIDEFRTRYLLTYTPRGVDGNGWHPIDVKLKGKRGTVVARRGYLK
jgi:Ca-activated chloride channel homolog